MGSFAAAMAQDFLSIAAGVYEGVSQEGESVERPVPVNTPSQINHIDGTPSGVKGRRPERIAEAVSHELAGVGKDWTTPPTVRAVE
jgi:hypothetical protein